MADQNLIAQEQASLIQPVVPSQTVPTALQAPSPETTSPTDQVAAAPVAPQYSGKFDAGGYLKAAGFTLNGTTDKKGVVKVTGPDGIEGTINVNDMLAKQGIRNADVIYNSPESALQTSPVGFGDRIRLALGNAQGQVNYLKANYEDAKLNSDGELAVKDKGVWHAVDPRGLGDGNGWDIAKEFGKDLVDLIPTVAQGAAQVAGASIGGAAGALAGGIGAVPGTLAGSAAGAGIASGVTAALGRIVGTYDATPEETLKHVGLDTVLGLAGEGVALGAKAAIVPTMKAALSKLSSIPGPSQSIISRLVQATTGMSEDAANLGVAKGGQVGSKVESILQRANAPQATPGLSDGIDRVIADGVTPGSDQAIKQVARQDSIKSVTPLLYGAQPKASAVYREGLEKAASKVGPDEFVDSTGALSKGVTAFMDEFKGIINTTGTASDQSLKYVVDPNILGGQMGIAPMQANRVAKSMNEFLNGAANIMQSSESSKGPEGLKALMSTMQKFDDMVHPLAGGQGQEDLKAALKGLSSKIKNEAFSGINPEARSIINQTSQRYSQLMPAVEMANDAIAGKTAGIEGVLNAYQTADPAKRLSIKENFKNLASIMGEGGQASYDDFNLTMAAAEWANAAPKTGAPSIVRVVPPRAALAVAPKIQSGIKGLAALGTTMRTMSESQRAAALANPDVLGAFVSTGLGAFGDPQQ